MKLLDTAYNKFGLLDKSAKNRIRAYLDGPTEAGWDDVKLIVICFLDDLAITIKAATIMENSSYALGRFPDAMTTARAIKKQLDFAAYMKPNRPSVDEFFGDDLA